MHKTGCCTLKSIFFKGFENCELVQTVVAVCSLNQQKFYLYGHLNLTNSFSNIHNPSLFDCKSCENENALCSNKDMLIQQELNSYEVVSIKSKFYPSITEHYVD